MSAPTSEPADPSQRRAEIRRVLRRRRADLPAAEHGAASMAVFTRLVRLPVLHSATAVAGYRGTRGEIDIDDALTHLRRQGTVVTVPRVEGTTMTFVRWDPDAPTATGSFGIEEPVGDQSLAFGDHDVVLVPLVAFDARGHRLGQGGGFYDRAIAEVSKRPVVIGIAHAFQEIAAVPTESWDQRLDAVVTDDAVLEFVPGVLDGGPS